MIYVNDILRICNGELICGDKNLKCTIFSKDTRVLNQGDVYVGIKGEVFDGNTFYKDAFMKGASACILDNKEVIDDKFDNGTIILVDNTIEAIQKLALYKRSLYNIPVVAITGSVGKTSVKDMVYAVMSSKYNVLCTKGNMNNHIGLPFTILSLDKHDAMIVEMGMNHLGEISLLSKIAKPTIGIITTIGTAHIGNLGSRENILKAKMELVDGIDNGTLILNNDNDLLRTVMYSNKLTIGIDNKSDIMAKNIHDNIFSSEFDIEDVHISMSVGSRAFVYNALFAYAIGKLLNINSNDIANKLKEFKLSPHRLELIKANNYTIIDDTYNASLDSVKNALELLGKINGRKVFIFGDILELDKYSKKIHQEIGELVIENKIDVLITVGEYAKETYNVVYSKGIEAHYFMDNTTLIGKIKEIIKENDTILVKASHGMNLVEIVDYLKI